MRRLFSTVLVLACLSVGFLGCKDDNNNDSPDLKASADLTAAGGEKCGAVLTCAQACTDATCIQGCRDDGATASVTKFNALLTCAFGVCTQAGDAGAPACTSATDASAGCRTCVSAASQSTACSTQLQACLGD